MIARHPNSHIQLLENKPIHNYILEEEVVYFKFTLLDDHDIRKLIFHVTAISGEVDVYLSRNDKNPFPNKDTADVKGYKEIESLKFTKSKDKPLKGNYYIAVRAWSASYYNINVKVYR